MNQRKNLQKMQVFLQMGDTLTEVDICACFFDVLLQCNFQQPLFFQKNDLATYYFSSKVELTTTCTEQYYSCAGDISYFPWTKEIGICLEDECTTMGVPRIKMGRLTKNLCQIQSLRTEEEAEICWQFVMA